MKQLLASPSVRLAARAAVAGILAAAASYQHSGGGTVAWHAIAAAGAMAFLEVFTPLNALVGVFKPNAPAIPLPVSPPPATPAKKPHEKR